MTQLQLHQNGAYLERLRLEFELARQALVQAEADLAQTQAAINAFRMHCRLKLDALVDQYLTLRTEKQSLLTQLQLQRQAQEAETALDDDFLAEELDTEDEVVEVADEPLLPTPTPRDKVAEKRLYRELARRFHPDKAVTAVEQAYATTMMSAINLAYEANDIDALYDLAGELAPKEVAELARIETPKVRQLRQRILRCQQRRRRVQRQLKTLRQENTARLWQQAQRLDRGHDDWWNLVRRELERAIAQREADIATLQQQLSEVIDSEREATPST